MAILEFLADLWANVIMFFAPTGTSKSPKAAVKLHNTLSGETETFKPATGNIVKMYNCGPTLYGPQHIGNLSMFVFTDILRRMLEKSGYTVRQAINFTDFGHLTSDADEGEDKMTKGLVREGMALTLDNMRVLAERYAEKFLADIAALNIKTKGTKFPRASDYIQAQIAMGKALEEKGYAYRGKSGVYFDTSRFASYGKLGNINLEGLKEGARVTAASDKRHPTDFLLWKSDDMLGWDSPWGKGFPGWHIECSAMIRAILGEQIDIHTGGIEHIPIHHNNEIAQSEAATGRKPFSRFWLHRAHLQVNGGKMAKSEGTVFYLSDIIERGFHPLAFRYLLLGAHYRQPNNFTWEALEAAQKAYLRLAKLVAEAPEGGSVPTKYERRFLERMQDDLDTPGALAALWDMVNSALPPADIRAGLIAYDAVLGLKLAEPDDRAKELIRKEFGEEVASSDIPDHLNELLKEREAARVEKNWAVADAARTKIESEGYVIEDTPEGPRLVKKG